VVVVSVMLGISRFLVTLLVAFAPARHDVANRIHFR
jgi:hypothetical protein